MGLQAVYSVYGLDYKKTYNHLFAVQDVEKLSEPAEAKGTFDFWLSIDEEKIKVQISNKGTVNLWHDDRACIDKAVRRLREFVVDSESKECKHWIYRNFFRIGYEDKRHLLQKDETLSISDAVLTIIWDELFELRDILHNPEDQSAQNWEVLNRLRSLVQMLPQDMKEKIMPSIDTFPDFSKEEEQKLIKDIEMKIGSRPIMTIGGFPFGEDEIRRKELSQKIMSHAHEKKIEEIIGKISSTLHEALKERR
jgi:hypothetical protein